MLASHVDPARPLLPDLPHPTHPVPAVDRETMLAADRFASDELGVTIAQMVENAGRELATLASLILGGSVDQRRAIVLAGTGNNGAGGMVAARRLASWGASVLVAFARPTRRLRPGPCAQLEAVLASDVEVAVAGHDLHYPELAVRAARADVLIDALIGYSLRGAPDDAYQPLIAIANRAVGPVLSLDLPSGIDASTGAQPGAAVAADATMAVALPKLGSTRGEGPRHAGALYLADIGIPMSVFSGLGVTLVSPFTAGPLLRLT